MKTYVIEPRDPVMFRDARPFGAGSDKTYSLEFAWPSTVAGFVRSRAGRDASGRFEMTPDVAKRLAVRGPWLVELGDEDAPTAFVPAPRDVVWFRGESPSDPWTRRRLGPSDWRAGELSDLQQHNLAPIAFVEDPGANPGKPAAGPSFWTWDAMRAWLGTPSTVEPMTEEARSAMGIDGLPHERRTHVKIDAHKKTADEGMLFSTDALRFARMDGRRGVRRFALACEAELGEHAARMTQGLSTLGGERRPVYVRETAATLLPPPVWTEADVSNNGCRVVLATPAVLRDGSVPTFGGGAGPTVHAACVGRPLSVSGWDLEKCQPKPTRRVVPAGSVYWLTWPEGTPASQIAAWMNTHWMQSLSEDPQDRRDGFGIMMTGRWG